MINLKAKLLDLISYMFDIFMHILH